MNVDVKKIDISGNSNSTFVGCHTINITHNNFSKELADFYTKQVDNLRARNSELTDRLIDQTAEITKYKLRIAQYEKELRKLKELI